jgi:hypothetical protein
MAAPCVALCTSSRRMAPNGRVCSPSVEVPHLQACRLARRRSAWGSCGGRCQRMTGRLMSSGQLMPRRPCTGVLPGQRECWAHQQLDGSRTWLMAPTRLQLRVCGMHASAGALEARAAIRAAGWPQAHSGLRPTLSRARLDHASACRLNSEQGASGASRAGGAAGTAGTSAAAPRAQPRPPSFPGDSSR